MRAPLGKVLDMISPLLLDGSVVGYRSGVGCLRRQAAEHGTPHRSRRWHKEFPPRNVLTGPSELFPSAENFSSLSFLPRVKLWDTWRAKSSPEEVGIHSTCLFESCCIFLGAIIIARAGRSVFHQSTAEPNTSAVLIFWNR